MGEEIARARHALELASGGNTVSIISGGDAGVYGMAGIVLEIAEKACAGPDADADAGTRIQVIPGVTAANAAASILGSPITGDFAVYQSERSADAVGGYREEDFGRSSFRLCDRSL